MILDIFKAYKSLDSETKGHMLRVAELSYITTKTMGLSESQCELAYVGGWFHDIGKAFLNPLILMANPISELQFRQLKCHTILGSNLIDDPNIARIVLNHHETLDGKGYLGLHEHDINLPTRIVTAADVFDAMTQQRGYRRKTPGISAAMEILRTPKYDQNVVCALESVISKTKS